MTSIPDTIKTACVYCGSSAHVSDIYKNSAVELGRYLVQNNVGVVYGGGRVGMMGILADTVVENKGSVIGIIPEYLVYKEIQHEHLTEMHIVDSMHTRKRMMVEKSDAFIVLPGGFGTLDEAFEIMTWRQLGMHQKPVVFVNINGYWDKLFDLVDHIAAEKFSGAESRNLFSIANSLDDLPAALSAAPVDALNPQTKWM